MRLPLIVALAAIPAAAKTATVELTNGYCLHRQCRPLVPHGPIPKERLRDWTEVWTEQYYADVLQWLIVSRSTDGESYLLGDEAGALIAN